MEATSLHFSSAVRALASTARTLELTVVPTFRSPPKAPKAERSLLHHADGSVTVAVRLRGRPWPAVLADMVEGIVAANKLEAVEAGGVRAALWSALKLANLVPEVDAPGPLPVGRPPVGHPTSSPPGRSGRSQGTGGSRSGPGVVAA